MLTRQPPACKRTPVRGRKPGPPKHMLQAGSNKANLTQATPALACQSNNLPLASASDVVHVGECGVEEQFARTLAELRPLPLVTAFFIRAGNRYVVQAIVRETEDKNCVALFLDRQADLDEDLAGESRSVRSPNWMTWTSVVTNGLPPPFSTR